MSQFSCSSCFPRLLWLLLDVNTAIFVSQTHSTRWFSRKYSDVTQRPKLTCCVTFKSCPVISKEYCLSDLEFARLQRSLTQTASMNDFDDDVDQLLASEEDGNSTLSSISL